MTNAQRDIIAAKWKFGASAIKAKIGDALFDIVEIGDRFIILMVDGGTMKHRVRVNVLTKSGAYKREILGVKS